MSPYKKIKRYLEFISLNKPAYLRFNRQLVIGELAGFGAGLVTAEIVSSFTKDEFTISTWSSVFDYAGSILGFFTIYYYDSTKGVDFKAADRWRRLASVLRSALTLWPSIAIADAAYIFSRPYFHYLLLLNGIEAGISAAIAHFAAFGVFNIVALFSKSLIDYSRYNDSKNTDGNKSNV